MERAYGETMGDYFAEQQAALQIRSAALDHHVAVTHMRYDGAGTGFTDPVPPQPALLMAVQLKPLLKHNLWVDGKDMRVKPYPAGALTMMDLQASPMANLASSYNCVQLYFARGALDALSEAEGVARFGEIPLINGGEDTILAHLAQMAVFAVSHVGPATPLFLETMALSVHRHLLKQYFGRAPASTAVRGGLAGWQERRVKEYIEAHLHAGIGLLALAEQAQLSPSQFGRAFKASVGITPHQWIISRRLARARALIAQPHLSLAEVARLCGFADPSHLAREFRKSEGVSASAWRKAFAING
ncbi:helix-turn-helix domain-containing protein [Duganella sp. FT109W]|uniref:Helix-turn-helix domain-containing protein n=1 Tax=Duganella margarita TaxID=2692170 RepID=A0ABW9WFB3_9BURK|nr:AraC family transcriptional regulator [Duganella margarita]MYN39794.1 helix-turn-helix domain-containing protein [Duganella margarita]